MRTIGVLLVSLCLVASNAAGQTLTDSTLRIVGKAVADYRQILPIRSARLNWCKVRPMRATIPDTLEMCAPWKTVEMPPDTGAVAYVQPFEVLTDHIEVYARVMWAGWVMQEQYIVRKNEWGTWMVTVYSVTYISRQ